MARDYVRWHDEYDQPGSRLHLRLLVVQDLVARALDELPPGPVRVLSLCAGQGHDVATVGARHRRGSDLTGRLIELDAANAASARARLADAGLVHVEVTEADAGWSRASLGAVPADLLLLCGIFGNVEVDDIERTLRFVPSLCAPGAWIVWTRYPEDMDVIESIERWLADSGCEVVIRVHSAEADFCVGAARFIGPKAPFADDVRLFTFVR